MGNHSYEDDVALVKEFLSINLTVKPHGWEIVQQHLLLVTGKDFLIRTLKQHIMLLIEIWLKKVNVDQFRSGVEEPQCERNALLQEVHSLCRENNYTFKEKKRSLSKDQQICNLGKKIREDYATSFCSNVEETEFNTIDSYLECSTSTVPPDATNDHDYAADSIEIIEVGPSEVRMEKTIISVDNVNTSVQPSTLASPMPMTSPVPTRTSSKAGETPSNKENRILEPSRKRINRKEPIRKNALSYLTDKHEKESKIRIMELELERRKVVVMERRVALDEKKYQLEEKKT